MTHLDRRMFLRGAAGATLALPFLPSLLRRASAGDPPRRPGFVALATGHGGVWTDHMFPAFGAGAETMSYRGHTIARRALAPSASGGRTVLSPVLQADAGRLTAKLVSKMNVVCGLDHPFYIAHHTGGHLGNYARNDGNGGDGQAMQKFPRPTVDQIMAWSPTFYAPTDAFKSRSIVVGGLSYGWSDTSSQSGSVEALASQYSSKQLFASIYTPPKTETSQRTPVINHVMDNYKHLRDGNRRLSAADRLRLEAHISKIDEVQRKLNVVAPASCKPVEPDESSELRNISSFGYDPSLQRQFWQLVNQVVATALSCGTCRIATLYVHDTFSDFKGDWHNDVAHQANIYQPDGHAQDTLFTGLRSYFEDVFVDLVAALDQLDDGLGNTVLDNTLVQWSQESGNVTHDSNSIPVVTAGSAAGRLSTGSLIDYRNHDRYYGNAPAEGAPAGLTQNSGLLYNQWLGNVLDVMGVERSRWQGQSDGGGYGKLLLGDGYTKYYDPQVYTDMNAPLPWLVKA